VRRRPATVLAALALLAPAAAVAANIQGSSRAERLKGTSKADRIQAVGGGRDRISCRAGTDIVTADATDVVARDCEFLSRRISVDSLGAAPGQHQTEVEPSAAASGSTVVASFQVGRFRDGGAAGIGWSTSFDAGRTWRSGILPSLTIASKPPGDASRASDPAVAFDAAHATWLVATLVLGNSYSALGISRSADATNWSAPILAARTDSPDLAYDKEWIGCDNATTSRFFGSCYLVYTDIAAGRLALQSSRDGGSTWSAPVTATTTFGADLVGALPLVQPDGALTIVFDGSDTGMFAVRSTDGGATFGAVVGISAISSAQQSFLRAPPLPAAAVDSSGRIYVVWADCRFRRNCDGNTVVLTTSTDGTTWTTPTRVPGTGFDSFVPGIAADPAAPGRLAVVTYVRTSTGCSLSTCAYGVAVTRSANGGATWSTPQRLDAVAPRYSWLANAGAQFVGDYVGAAFAAGRFVPVFALAQQPTAGGAFRESMFAASLG
jgi:hypothetical protein